MGRTSQTRLAVLGGLSVEPMTGYALRAAISETLGHFWRESFGQIYPTLTRLEAEGHVRRTSPGRTSGSRFEITESGVGELRRLLAEPVDPVPPRNGLLLRLFFGRQLGTGAARGLLEQARADAQRQLGQYRAIRAQVAAEPEGPDTQYWLITVSAGEHAAAAQLAWAQEALAELDGTG